MPLRLGSYPSASASEQTTLFRLHAPTPSLFLLLLCWPQTTDQAGTLPESVISYTSGARVVTIYQDAICGDVRPLKEIALGLSNVFFALADVLVELFDRKSGSW